jgi:hypothetical protein
MEFLHLFSTVFIWYSCSFLSENFFFIQYLLLEFQTPVSLLVCYCLFVSILIHLFSHFDLVTLQDISSCFAFRFKSSSIQTSRSLGCLPPWFLALTFRLSYWSIFFVFLKESFHGKHHFVSLKEFFCLASFKLIHCLGQKRTEPSNVSSFLSCLPYISIVFYGFSLHSVSFFACCQILKSQPTNRPLWTNCTLIACVCDVNPFYPFLFVFFSVFSFSSVPYSHSTG